MRTSLPPNAASPGRLSKTFAHRSRKQLPLFNRRLIESTHRSRPRNLHLPHRLHHWPRLRVEHVVECDHQLPRRLIDFQHLPSCRFQLWIRIAFPHPGKIHYHNAQGKATFRADYEPIEGDPTPSKAPACLMIRSLTEKKLLPRSALRPASITTSPSSAVAASAQAFWRMESTEWLPSPYTRRTFSAARTRYAWH